MNYISGVRLLHKLLGIEAPALHSFDLHLMLRATRLTMTTTAQQKLPVTPHILIKLCTACELLGDFGVILKCAILFGFFAFLRQSNLAPPQAKVFNPHKHTCRGDIIQRKTGLSIILKWTKTLPMGSSPQLIPLPAVPHCPLNMPSARDISPDARLLLPPQAQMTPCFSTLLSQNTLGAAA